MAYTMVYRGVKGSPLTNTEVDTNFSNLDTYKAPLDNPAFTTAVGVTGQLTAVSASGALIASNGSGTGQTSIQLKRVGAATDQKMFEINSDSSGAFVIRSVNDAYSSNAAALTIARSTGYSLATMTLMSSGGRVLVGSGADDGVNAFQVTGNMETDSSLKLTGTASGLEIGATGSANTPFVDFHSSGNNIDYDARISATGGSTTVGTGSLSYIANNHTWTIATGTAAVLNSNGRFILGGGTDDGASTFQINTGNQSIFNGIINATRYGSSGAIRLRGAGGTSGTPTSIGNATTIAQYLFTGYDGSVWKDTAQIAAISSVAWTTSIASTYLAFYTTATGSNTLTEGMRLTADNRLLLNQTSDNTTHTLQVTNGIISTSSGTVGGLVATGAGNSNSALYLINTTATTGRSYSVMSGSAGMFTINDETASSATRFQIVGGQNRILLAGATDDGATNVQAAGTFRASGLATLSGGLTVSAGSFVTNITSNQLGVNQATAGIELGGGSPATTVSFIDFHASTSNNDYDCRIYASGGNATVGRGTMSLYGASIVSYADNFKLYSTNAVYSGLLIFSANSGSYNPFMRANATNASIEFVNSANTAVNLTVYDSGNAVVRNNLTVGSLTSGSAVFNTGSVQVQNFGGSANSGVVYFGTSGSRYLYYNATSDTYAMPNARFDLTNAANQFSVTYPGKAQWFPCVDSNGAYTVYNAGGTGVFVSNGSTAWSANSDERLKNIREDITGAVDMVESIRTVKFTWKAEDDYNEAYGLEDDAKKVIGVIAQDVEAVLPEAITHNTNGYLGVQYTDLIPVCMAAIKELSARVKELEAKLAEKE